MTFDRAKEVLYDSIDPDMPNGGLFNRGWYLAYGPGSDYAVLDGHFTAEQLEAVVVYMQHYPPQSRTASSIQDSGAHKS